MTPHGKGAVKAILDYEEKDLSHYSRLEENGQIVTLPKARKNRDGLIEIKVYDQPAAAGLGNYLDDPEFRVEQYPEYAIPDKVDFGVLNVGGSSPFGRTRKKVLKVLIFEHFSGLFLFFLLEIKMGF